jgi:hypothetical protein
MTVTKSDQIGSEVRIQGKIERLYQHKLKTQREIIKKNEFSADYSGELSLQEQNILFHIFPFHKLTSKGRKCFCGAFVRRGTSLFKWNSSQSRQASN